MLIETPHLVKAGLINLVTQNQIKLAYLEFLQLSGTVRVAMIKKGRPLITGSYYCYLNNYFGLFFFKEK